MSEKPTEAEGLPKRLSARRKLEVVLRGEDIGEVSREIRVPPPEMSMGIENVTPRGRGARTRAKLGEMTMRVELQAELLEKRGYGEELKKLLRRAGG